MIDFEERERAEKSRFNNVVAMSGGVFLVLVLVFTLYMTVYLPSQPIKQPLMAPGSDVVVGTDSTIMETATDTTSSTPQDSVVASSSETE